MDTRRVHVGNLRGAGLFSLSMVLFFIGCGKQEEAAKSVAPAAAESASQSQSSTPFVPVDACSLLSKEEVEGLTSKAVLEPLKDEYSELVICSYGDPNSSQIAPGRALSQILRLSVVTGREGAYYAGPVAQAKDSLEMARKNASSPQTVRSLGDDAFWDEDLNVLRIIKNRYLLEITVEPDKGLELAKTVAERALAKLP